MIIFCADANSYIGSGHVMRCCSIADELKRRGVECVFVTSSPDIVKALTRDEFGVISSGCEYNYLDATTVCEFIRDNNVQAVVVDSYFVTPAYLKMIHRCANGKGCRLMYIDDLLTFDYPCDFLLNYNIFAEDNKMVYENQYTNMPSMLLGCKYAPLRKEFYNMPVRKVEKYAKNILISTGGADKEHILLTIAKSVSRYKELDFHLLLGAMNDDKKEIETIADMCHNIYVHENVKDMCALMQSVDVAISAAGSTLYELCATQTPTITYVMADNQIPGAEGFERHGIMQSIGDVRTLGIDFFVDILLQATERLCNDYKKRTYMAVRMRSVVDGRGCERIADVIMDAQGE